MSNHRFTPRLLRTLQFVKKTQEALGVAPSYSEIADHFKINPTAARERVNRCVILGYLTVTPHKARTLRFTQSGLTKIKAEGDYYENN